MCGISRDFSIESRKSVNIREVKYLNELGFIANSREVCLG